MNTIVKTLELLTSGIDPLTGEVFDLEALKHDNEVAKAVNTLYRVYSAKKPSYRQREAQFPNHIILMREGYFFSAHNKSAYALNDVLRFRLFYDTYGRLTTGGPNVDKIITELKAQNLSFVLVDEGVITNRFDGDTYETTVDLDSIIVEQGDSQSARNSPTEDESSVTAPYPESLLVALMKTTIEDEPQILSRFSDDIEARLDAVIKGFPEQVQAILNRRYVQGNSLGEIGREFSLSSSRVYQIIQKHLRRMRSKAVMDQLTPTVVNYVLPTIPRNERTRQTKSSSKAGIVTLSSEQLAQFEYSNDTITLSDIAKKLNALKDIDQIIKFDYKVLAQLLVDFGYLMEHTSDTESIGRVPTPLGNEIGIHIENRTGYKGDYRVVAYNETAQKHIIEKLDAYLNKSL